MQAMPPGQQLDRLATFVVDNTAGPVPLDLYFSDTQATLTVPPYAQQVLPGLTGLQSFTVSAPLAAKLPAPFTAIVVALNVPLPPQPPQILLPDANAGSAIAVNLTSIAAAPATVPGGAVIYNSLTIDNTLTGVPVNVEGIDMNGAAWSAQQAAGGNAEFAIPPTLAGSTVSVQGNTTNASVAMRFRVAPVGLVRSTVLSIASLQQQSFSLAGVSGAGTVENVVLPATWGGLLVAVKLYAVGASGAWGATLSDTTAGGGILWEAAYPTGDIIDGADFSYVTSGQGDGVTKGFALTLTGAAGAVTGTFTGSLTFLAVPNIERN